MLAQMTVSIESNANPVKTDWPSRTQTNPEVGGNTSHEYQQEGAFILARGGRPDEATDHLFTHAVS